MSTNPIPVDHPSTPQPPPPCIDCCAACDAAAPSASILPDASRSTSSLDPSLGHSRCKVLRHLLQHSHSCCQLVATFLHCFHSRFRFLECHHGPDLHLIHDPVQLLSLSRMKCPLAPSHNYPQALIGHLSNLQVPAPAFFSQAPRSHHRECRSSDDCSIRPLTGFSQALIGHWRECPPSKYR